MERPVTALARDYPHVQVLPVCADYTRHFSLPVPDNDVAGIVASHSLIPEALRHAFATYGVLLSPDLPLSRRQHEMIATVVSVTNRCLY